MINKLLWEKRWRLFFVAILNLIIMLFTILPLDYLGEIVDGVNNKTMSSDEIKYRVILMLIMAIAYYIIQGIYEYYVFRNYYESLYEIQKIILEKVLKQNPQIFKKISVGEILSRITGDVEDYIAVYFSWGLYCFTRGVLGVLIIFIFILFKIDLIFVVLINIPYLFATYVIISQKEKYENLYAEMTKKFDDISDKTLESIKGVRIVRSYNMLNKLSNEFKDNILKYAKLHLNYSLRSIYSHGINILAVGFSYFSLIIYGYYQYIYGNITFGTIISVSLIMFLMPWPYTVFASYFISRFDMKLGYSRIKDILDLKDDNLINENGKKLKFSDKIEFRNFSFSYDGKPTLKNIDLVINKGDTIGIVGKTGSGKTTLIKQLLRFYEGSMGIYIDNVPIQEYNLVSLRENFGYSPQEYFIFSKTIKENVLFNRDIEDKLEYALEVADLNKDIKGFKKGVDTLVGENGIALSGGQKQRLSIARAIINNPEILIFDDSLSALDIKTEKNIIRRLNENRKGKTNIIVSHRISSVINADKILILSEGKIEKIGTHDELLLSSKWYKGLYEYQNKEEVEAYGK
ncbi:ABC transporter ATP-binding protein [Streptobacillus moniliformis]|uniref:ABC transporter ATP-binding protein n=2 Tax=Streptobacillus moniliformis TaxID=34105 RepID=UPI0007E38A56|nr:ABC transporter ATP-binding protein [Streptobacillus moniliformis]